MHQARDGARAARTAPIPADLNPQLREALAASGAAELYTHQAQAIEAAWQGPTITTTGTASGKSLCYLVPTAEVLLGDPRARALYLARRRPSRRIRRAASTSSACASCAPRSTTATPRRTSAPASVVRRT